MSSIMRRRSGLTGSVDMEVSCLKVGEPTIFRQDGPNFTAYTPDTRRDAARP